RTCWTSGADVLAALSPDKIFIRLRWWSRPRLFHARTNAAGSRISVDEVRGHADRDADRRDDHRRYRGVVVPRADGRAGQRAPVVRIGFGGKFSDFRDEPGGAPRTGRGNRDYAERKSDGSLYGGFRRQTGYHAADAAGSRD